MSGKTFKELGLNHKDLSTKNIPVVVGASGASLGAIGEITCKITLGKEKKMQTFLVCENLTRSLILSVNFARKYAAGVHWTKHNSFVLTTDRKTVAENEGKHQKATVSLKSRTKIPPRMTAVVDMDINTSSKDKVLMVLDEYCFAANPNMYMCRQEEWGGAFFLDLSRIRRTP